MDTSSNSTSISPLRSLAPYLLRYRGRVLLILVLLTIAKIANLGIPLAFKKIVDGLDPAQFLVIVPTAMLLAYGALRLAATVFSELRGILFAVISTRARREAALKAFQHLHKLSLRFHLEKQTGGVTRAIEKGTGSIEDFLYYALVSIVPTIIEVCLALAWLLYTYRAKFALATLATLILYVFLTIVITNWRTRYYREANKADQDANAKSVDSLLNYETVKYFGNEAFEAKRYDQSLAQYEVAARKSWMTLTVLNTAQSLVIALGVTALMWMAAIEVSSKHMTLGDLILVNALLIQLYMPLSMLGMMYRDIKQALTDMERMFGLLREPAEIRDQTAAPALQINAGEIRFEHVGFSYDGERTVLRDLDFVVPAGKTVAVVGHSGAGKSTLSRLLFRFYDVSSGAVRIDGQDIRAVSQDSLRAVIGIVPQDTVLFNDSIYYNIAYGNPDASEAQVHAAAAAAHIHDFILSLPQGYDSPVGERGLKLSGGEKQRVAIARALLKNPPIMIFDEATSALDSRTEQSIQTELEDIAKTRTTLVIAHRLSTIVNSDQILVLDGGRVIERGTHSELLSLGRSYAHMWQLQQSRREAEPTAMIA
jgi:ATP-binding cassette, subfamily B, heavy metal transporter